MFYDFQCPNCGHEFEKRISFTDHDTMYSTYCPECKGLAKRKYSPLDFRWKKGQELK